MPSLNTGNAILSNPIKVDSSYNVGIGGAASGSYKLQVTGTGNFTGALSGTSATFSSNISTTAATIFAKASGTEPLNYQLSAITLGYDATNNIGWITAGGAASRTNLVLQQGGGNVQIGSVSSSDSLTISKSTYPQIRLVETTTSPNPTSIFGYDSPSAEWRIRTVQAYPLTFGTNDTERMRISSAGIITAPSQVSFKAYITGANPTLPKGVSSTIPYNNEQYDIQGNFNTSTYKFTAPVAGRYLFIVNVNFYGVDDTSFIVFRLVINSSDVRNLFTMSNLPTGNTGDTNLSGSDILNLAAGDTVEVKLGTDGSGSYFLSAGLTYNTFSGHLLG